MIILPWIAESDVQFLLQATIIRPAVMIGTEDRILNAWACFAKNYSFLPLLGDGSTKYVMNLVNCNLVLQLCKVKVLKTSILTHVSCF